MKKINKIIIIGSGPSGYTSAIYLARANLKPILITGKNEGGQIIKSNKIENWPGKKKISGIKLINNMKKQAINFNTKIIYDKIKKIKIYKKIFIILGKKKYLSKSIIIATGCKPKLLNIKNEKKLYGKGISNCAYCDGFFYKNKIIAIVGGGNNAIEECILMYKIAKKIFIIHRKEKFTSDKILFKKIKNKIKKKKIIFLKNYIILKIKKKKKYIYLKLKSNKKKKIKKIKINGLFISIGYKPNTKIFKNLIKLDKNKYIKINYKNSEYTSMTNIKGIFACGDVTNYKYKQAIIASSLGCIAALDVQKYLENL